MIDADGLMAGATVWASAGVDLDTALTNLTPPHQRSTMSTDNPRMTPKQIAEEWEPVGQRRQMLLDLAAVGYVIVHPEDVPEMSEDDDLYLDAPYGVGYNDARRRIFGGDR